MFEKFLPFLFLSVVCLSICPIDSRAREINISSLRCVDSSKNNFKGELALLDSFYENLYQLRVSRNKGENIVSIVHIGDSHLQAGFLSGTVMMNLQIQFGCAGRGFIAPLRLANTNEPVDYNIGSTSHWKASRCISFRMPFDVGIGGLSLMALDNQFDFQVRMRPKNGIDYSFNRVQLFRAPQAPTMNMTPSSALEAKISEPYPFVTQFDLNKRTNTFSLSGRRQHKGDSCIYYGMNLENGKNGVLYHAIGLNGAQFFHYRRVKDFAEQVSSLSPQIILFSLGTNEAFRGNFRESQIIADMSRVIDPIVEKNPGAVIVITTPAECQYPKVVNGERVYVPNPFIEPIRNTMIKYATEKKYVIWDLYEIAGGKGSSEAWIRERLLARDRVHFEIEGYKIQGVMLYQAFIKGFNQYARNRIQ